MGLSLSRSSNKLSLSVSGPLLLADFKFAMNNLSTAATAKYVAERSEQDTLQTINAAAARNNVYVTPNDLSPEQQSELVRSSLNAHLQKAQSEQIVAFTDQQVAQMEAEDRSNYKGRKVRIRVTDPKFEPIESFWQDKHTGQVRQGRLKTKSIKGIIDDLSFTKNLLVLRPTLKSRLILPDRKYLVVYVINPETLVPAVEIELL